MELMITVAIIGILFAIALPRYQDYVVRANRDAAKAVLLEIISRQEQYASTNRAYATTTAALGLTVPAEVTANYTLTLAQTQWCSPATASSCPPLTGAADYLTVVVFTGFTATATPIAGTGQENDGTLSINQFGLKTRTVGGTTAPW